MVVRAIEEEHPRAGIPQGEGGAQAAKSSSDDDDYGFACILGDGWRWWRLIHGRGEIFTKLTGIKAEIENIV